MKILNSRTVEICLPIKTTVKRNTFVREETSATCLFSIPRKYSVLNKPFNLEYMFTFLVSSFINKGQEKGDKGWFGELFPLIKDSPSTMSSVQQLWPTHSNLWHFMASFTEWYCEPAEGLSWREGLAYICPAYIELVLVFNELEKPDWKHLSFTLKKTEGVFTWSHPHAQKIVLMLRNNNRFIMKQLSSNSHYNQALFNIIT